MKRVLSFVATIFFTLIFVAQTNVNYSKLSSHLAGIVRNETSLNQQRAKSNSNNSILALIALTDIAHANDVFNNYDCKQIDKIGRIFIVDIPINQIPAMSLDSRIERIEAERMPQPAMDTSPQIINATNVYNGTDLPQAFTGNGVVSGIFDCYFDFTHPAFFDENGNTRIKYYYDMLWKNDDNTLGKVFESSDEILQLEHSQNTYNHTHGTHVAGTMAGSSVDGKYMGMAPGSDIYLVDFNSDRKDFENPNEHTSATAVLGFKYIFDKAEAEGKPCVINFSSCESITLTRQRKLEGEALEELVGPGKIIVSACGNMGHQIPYMEKPADMRQAGVFISNGIGGGQLIDMDIVTPTNQKVRFDFWGIRLTDTQIESSITFNTDSIKFLTGDTCILKTSVSMGDIELRIYKSEYQDQRGDVYHIDGIMPNIYYLLLCGATCVLTSDSPAWLYSDLFYSPFSNIEGIPEFSCLKQGYSVSWPASLPFIIAVGATGYKTTFTNLAGEKNEDVISFAPDATGLIAKFSSLGPTFDGLIKPDIVAPGMNINAAYNSFSSDYDNDKKSLTDKVTYNNKVYYYMAQSGTSMASPIVAGAIALWLEANPRLSPDDILNTLALCSQHPDKSMEYPNCTYGHGQIDVYQGLIHVLNLNSNIPDLYKHQPSKAKFSIENTTLKVTFDSEFEPSDISLTIYSMNGMKMLLSHDLTVDLSHLPKGIYAVQLNTGLTETSGSTLIRL